ncbi:4Fe-4S dicluster domain-containing protein [Texcoconibacillus texcoconensis]|uniref:Fe-S-cluster-containing dehydrogenase component n=1 Tax=Texcoconibacillus texcoconensis TaxID=1095777 RepID=A0A840QPI5_9BACI|nr:4Fe-4S dicluster domain-containing protein [Texcoconibacillus texcoconensis]MBB5173326.1 Fe-S-cluster-containing dehydrogenase component [Texcoconibacillus texcoconensis]
MTHKNEFEVQEKLPAKSVTRRSFLKGATAISAAASVAWATKSTASAQQDFSEEEKLVASIIDLNACDGCENEPTPLCVTACKDKNKHRFPQPEEEPMDYWPRQHHEDWSKEQDRTDRLTPYNWTYVEQVTVNHNGQEKTISIPRRCMHCLDAPCQNLCPFGVIGKTEEGAVHIDEYFCMGGAKCRDSCPWDIPQRQAGVGVYMDLMPKLGGGGVMYKCDMCADYLKEGKAPACETACPKDAIQFGPLDEMRKKAYELASERNGYVYGDTENAGTLTFYISDIPFDQINEAIAASKHQDQDERPGRPHMEPDIENMLDTAKGFMLATLIAPVAGAAAAGVNAYRKLKSYDDTKIRKDVSYDE